jgi:hypothetical protein
MSEITATLATPVNSMGQWQVDLAEHLTQECGVPTTGVNRSRLANGQKLRVEIEGAPPPTNIADIIGQHAPADVESVHSNDTVVGSE